MRRQVEINCRELFCLKSNASLFPHPSGHWWQQVRFIPAIVEHSGAVAIETRSAIELFIRRVKCAAVAVLVVESAERNVRSFQKDVESALWKRDVQIGNLAKDIAHRHVKRVAFFER